MNSYFHFSAARRTESAKRRAFTLIELLVVIAIIALLAAILFPVFGRARENARRSSCQSNEKQMGLGIAQYVQDYDEKYPAWARPNPGTTGNSSIYWMTQIMPYVKSVQLFKCPSNVTQTSANDNLGVPNHYSSNYYSDSGNYGAVRTNGNGIGVFCDTDAPGINSSAINSPSTTIAVSELRQSDTFLPPSGYNSNKMLWAGHLGTTNYLFADGHVKSMRPMDTIPPVSPVNMWTGKKDTAVGETGTDQSTVVPAAVLASMRDAVTTFQ